MTRARGADGARVTGQRGDFRVRRSPGALLALFAALALTALTPGAAPAAPDPLASLKTGQWVRLEGVLSADSTARCDELRILTGDFVDDDWIVKGFIQALNTPTREFTVGGIRIQITDNTGFDSPRKAFRGFEALSAGLLVEAEGTYLKNRKFLAVELDDESRDVENEPWPRNQIQIVARVERVEARKRLVTAMGFTFQVTGKTRIRSVIE